MHLLSVLVATCVVNIEIVYGQNIGIVGSHENENHETQSTETNLVDHTFVALIDIVFTDNSKRTCTGSIIHDNVVITAAHCFIVQTDLSVLPELTTSFVVIGTKKMFDTGYEQYLPIERVLTHPRFSGWTADLCLVFTFAGMTSDKPGTIIPLAGVKTSTHVDSNVTVLSWGHMQDIDSKPVWALKHEKCPDSESQEDFVKGDENKKDNKHVKVTAMLWQPKIRQRSNSEVSSIPLIYKKESTFDTFRTQYRAREKTQNKPTPLKARSQKTKLISRYLSGEERVTVEPAPVNHHHRHHEYNETKEEDVVSRDPITEPNHSMVTEPELNSYKDWRRRMGSQQNQLKVEIFGFVNVQACKKMVEKGMPAKFDISEGNDVVCYATEDNFISDEDSGAPAVRRGQLVAVTAGGAEIDGDHVAVGMKMSCYCTWITDNLPAGENNFNCCKNCCDVTHRESFEDATTYKRRNKALYRN